MHGKQDKMKKWSGPFLIGSLILVLWISHIPYLFEFPLRLTPGMQRLSNEGVETPDLIKDLLTTFRIAFAKRLFLCLLGIISGVLILKRKRVGRYLAIGISAYMLASKAYFFLSHGNPFQKLYWWKLYWTYEEIFPKYPFRIIHMDILTGLILFIALVCLLHPKISNQFRDNTEKENITAG